MFVIAATFYPPHFPQKPANLDQKKQQREAEEANVIYSLIRFCCCSGNMSRAIHG